MSKVSKLLLGIMLLGVVIIAAGATTIKADTKDYNEIYAKAGKKNAVLIPSKYFTKLTFKKNTCKKW